MSMGIISNKEDEEMARFVIDSAFEDLDIVPITCILTGSRVYGLSYNQSDRDYVGLHIMDTWNCLEHPKYRQNLQVVRRVYDKDLNLCIPGTIQSIVSLDSYELWKMVDILLKGAFIIYELVYLPAIHHDPSSNKLISLVREGLTTKIGMVSIGNCRSQQNRFRNNRKKTIMSYYRLIQAIYFLRENEFQWNAESLWEYAGKVIPAGQATLKIYKEENRTSPLQEGEIYFIQKELIYLISETENAMVASRLPDRCPKQVLQEILKVIKLARSNLI